MALSYAFETSAFTVITMLAGAMGALHVAGLQIAMNYNAFCFMISIGMATATAVRVGNAVGRHDQRGMRIAGWTGAGLILAIMLAIAAVTLALRPLIASLYTSDPTVLVIALPALFVTAFLLVGDSMQAVLVGALRGTADVWATTLIGLSSFWLIMVPSAWLLGVHRGGGVPGLMWGEVVGVTVATVLLTLRFRAISRRHVKPV
jgi:MATE family multidrug resistance protein